MSIAEQLQQGSREISMPVELVLAGGERIVCTSVLRVLPYKRAVIKATWQGKPVLVKLLPNTASGKRNARREQEGHRILQSANITTPKLLLTSRCDDKSYVMVFEFFHQAQHLGDLWRDHAERRSEIAAAVLRVIASLHRHGCIHTDPHFNNFLLVDKRLYVIDVASIKHCTNGNYGSRQRRNLAFFLAYFNPTWRKILSEMLSQHYIEAAHDRRLPRHIERASQRRKSRYMKKVFRECSDFSTHKSWRKRAVWRRAEYDDELADFLQNPDAWVQKGECLKDGNSATVVRVQLGMRQVVIKRNNRKNIRHWLRCLFRTTRACVNWRNAHLLGIGGIATPAPVAFIETRWGPLRLGGYYVCDFNPAPSSAKKYESPNGSPPTEQELKWFKALFENMRLARLYHGDLKASNLLVSDTGIEVIDLDSVKKCTTKNINTRQQKDRDRFLENWKDNPALLKSFSKVLDGNV